MPWTPKEIDQRLNPSSVAVVGARRADDYMWLRSMTDFKGEVYSVQIAPDDIAGIEEMGVRNYKSLAEIPGPVDYVIVAVPRRASPFVLKDAIAKGVKTVHMFTSGFAESDEEGVQLQQQITEMAQEAGVMVIGPNCMGLFNPAVGLRTGAGQDVEQVGSVGIIAQSGGHNNALVQSIQASGVAINKAISFGNGIVLDSPDLLDYFAADDDTKIILAYIEGPRDGRRFFEALRGAAARKPVLLWKGGQTEAGHRTVASHTGSLAGSMEIWDAIVRQTGAIRIDSFEEAVDVVKALVYLPPLSGGRVGIIGGTGGQSVSMADEFTGAGLQVPALARPTLDAMAEFFQLVGAAYFNPVDVGMMNREHIEAIIDLLAGDPNIDVVAFLLSAQAGRRTREQRLEEMTHYQQAGKKAGKPVVAMFQAPIPYKDGAVLEELDDMLQELGLPVFVSPTRAAAALKKAADYYAAH